MLGEEYIYLGCFIGAMSIVRLGLPRLSFAPPVVIAFKIGYRQVTSPKPGTYCWFGVDHSSYSYPKRGHLASLVIIKMHTLTTIYETTQLCFDFVESSEMYEEVDATEQPEQRYDNVSAQYCV